MFETFADVTSALFGAASSAPSFLTGVAILILLITGAAVFVHGAGGGSLDEATTAFYEEVSTFDRTLESDVRLVDDLIRAGASQGLLEGASTRFRGAETEEQRWIAGQALVEEMHEAIAVLETHEAVSRQDLRLLKRRTAEIERSRQVAAAASDAWYDAFGSGTWLRTGNAPSNPFDLED